MSLWCWTPGVVSFGVWARRSYHAERCRGTRLKVVHISLFLVCAPPLGYLKLACTRWSCRQVLQGLRSVEWLRCVFECCLSVRGSRGVGSYASAQELLRLATRHLLLLLTCQPPLSVPARVNTGERGASSYSQDRALCSHHPSCWPRRGVHDVWGHACFACPQNTAVRALHSGSVSLMLKLALALDTCSYAVLARQKAHAQSAGNMPARSFESGAA